MPADGATAGSPPTSPDTVPAGARPRLGRHVRMHFDRARERQVLLGPESVIVLNATGADILRLCDGRRTVAAIEAELQERYDRVVDDEVRGFLTRLAARHCVEIDDG
ncbi:MAG: pyrroloquinoline quinone biosynthesis peptide chaperone PqqD [Pseudonocardiaceae bacterium]|nr:pyrroloquinoline quinone biosynthesis peptide chaperone PqqD [Pseudonocardiaceae bacterium]